MNFKKERIGAELRETSNLKHKLYEVNTLILSGTAFNAIKFYSNISIWSII